MAELRVDTVGVIGEATRQGGTGQVVAPDLVLTARHTLAPPGGAAGGAKVYPWLPDDPPSPGHLAAIPMDLAWAPEGPYPDAALLRVRRGASHTLRPLRRFRFGVCQAQESTAETVGFPRLDRDRVAFDGLENFPGTAFRGRQSPADATWTVAFRSTRELKGDPEGWKGLSGAALFCGELLVGVFEKFPTAFDPKRELHLVSLATLLRYPGFRDALGLPADFQPELAPILAAPPILATQAGPSAAPTLGELAGLLHTLDRTPEVQRAQLAFDKVAGTAPLEIVVAGTDQDLQEEFVRRLAEDVWQDAMPLRVAFPDGAMLDEYGDTALAGPIGKANGLGGVVDFAGLADRLMALPRPRWLWLDLPARRLDAGETELLRGFRDALAGRLPKDGSRFGWVLGWRGGGELPAALLLPKSADLKPLGGTPALRQIAIALAGFPRSQLLIWPQDLSERAALRKQRAEAAGSTLDTDRFWPALAREVADRLAPDYDPVRLEWVQRLLDGRPLPPPPARNVPAAAPSIVPPAAAPLAAWEV